MCLVHGESIVLAPNCEKTKQNKTFRAFLGYAEVFGNKLIATMWIEEINLHPWKKYLLESTMEKKSSTLCTVL